LEAGFCDIYLKKNIREYYPSNNKEKDLDLQNESKKYLAKSGKVY